MATIQLRLFATLREYWPGLGMGEHFPVDLPDGASVRDLVQQLGLPEEQVKLVFANGLYQTLGHILANGDEVGVFPAVGGRLVQIGLRRDFL